MIGSEATELIQGFVIATNLVTTEEELIHTVCPHATLSEMMHESVLDAHGRAIHKYRHEGTRSSKLSGE
jgi:dihydrolipoamide dehydrogenase